MSAFDELLKVAEPTTFEQLLSSAESKVPQSTERSFGTPQVTGRSFETPPQVTERSFDPTPIKDYFSTIPFGSKDIIKQQEEKIKSEEQKRRKPLSTFEKLVIGMDKPSLSDTTNVALMSGGIVDVGKEIVSGITSRFLKSSLTAEDKTLMEANKYVSEQVSKQAAARIAPKKPNIFSEAKRILVDFASPIEDVLGKAESKYKFQVLPSQDVRPQIDRVLRSPTLAGQFARDNGLEKVIKSVDNLDNLDQYMIAKQAIDLSKKGIKTGRDLLKDAQLVETFAPKYEPQAQIVRDYSSKLLDYVTDSGLISKDLNIKLKQMYPNYVPMNRIMSEIDNAQGVGRTGVASLSKQTVVQGIKGSEREVESPLGSLLAKTETAFNQAERNKAAQMITRYKDIPNNPFELKLIEDEVGKKSTISVFKNGIKEIWEVNPDIARAAKSLNVQQLNIIGQIAAVPIRVAKLGITGLYLPFAAGNIIRDQLFTAITSRKSLATSIANPENFVKSLFSVVKHDDLYQEMVRMGAGGTSFDIARNQPHLTIDQIRSGKNLGSKILYIVRHPSEMLKAVEDIVSRSEELTRMTQYRGTKQAFLKEGRTAQDASLLAAQAARENSANFSRRGEWGPVLNSVFLYLNAGIQGSRSLVRSMARQPIATSSKIATTLLFPSAVITAWNVSDPKRKAAYEDIQEYEKTNNLIVVPPNPTQDEKGRWNVIKIPLPYGVGGLAYMVRKPIEQAAKIDEFKVQDMANQLIGSVSPVNPDMGSIMSTFVPQAIKPSVEVATNKNLFTGMPLVSRKMENVEPSEQARAGTSGTARIIGKAINQSPLKVEHFTRATFGGVGSQALNLSDILLNKAGKIPAKQVGGEPMLEGFTRRFMKATGGRIENKTAEDIKVDLTAQETEKLKLNQQAELKWEEIKASKNREEAQAIINSIPIDSPIHAKLVQISNDENKGIHYSDRLIKQLNVENGARAIYIFKKTIDKSKSIEDRQSYLNDLIRKEVITPVVAEQINGLLKQYVERK